MYDGYNGRMSTTVTANPISLKPVIYLDTKINVTGTGTIANPYIIN